MNHRSLTLQNPGPVVGHAQKVHALQLEVVEPGAGELERTLLVVVVVAGPQAHTQHEPLVGGEVALPLQGLRPDLPTLLLSDEARPTLLREGDAPEQHSPPPQVPLAVALVEVVVEPEV